MSSFKVFTDSPYNLYTLLQGTTSEGNSTTVSLSANHTFTGKSINVLVYPTISCSIISDQQGVLYIDFSSDNINWDISYSYVYTTINSSMVKRVNVAAKYLRIRYVNGSTNQSVFRLQTILGSQLPELTVNTSQSTLEYPRVYQDAFQRLRTSEIQTIFDSKQIYQDSLSGSQTLFWDTKVTGGSNSVSYNATEAESILSVSETGSVIRQTFQRFNYQPGKSQLCLLTGVIRSTGVFSEDVTSKLGYFDSNNGVFFQYNGSLGSAVVVRKNAVDTVIGQNNWNIDTMDGSGPSGINLDFSKTQIYIINFEWLGVGSIWWGVNINGINYWVHQENNANIRENVYMRTPNNPIRYEITSASGGSGSMTSICTSVNTEGGLDSTGLIRTICRQISNPVNANSVGVEYVVLLLRYKDLQASQITLNLISSSLLSTTNDNYMWLIRLLPNLNSVSGAFSAWESILNSPVEVNRTDGLTITNDNSLGASGTIIASGYGTSKTSETPSVPIENLLRIGFNIDGISQIVCLSVIPITSGMDIYGSLTWREVS